MLDSHQLPGAVTQWRRYPRASKPVNCGLATVEGKVTDAYGSGFGKQVIVAVILEGSDQPLTATFRADAVELAAERGLSARPFETKSGWPVGAPI